MEEHTFKNKQTRKGVRTLTSRQTMGLVLGLAGIVLAFLFVYLFLVKPFIASRIIKAASSSPVILLSERDPLTGVVVEHAQTNKQIYGVMIDEHIDARPQSGIDQAFLVIEAPVEAGIPRLLAFFSADQNIEKIGPVRSARPYFVDWVNELDALYVHVGGSNEALDKISTGVTFDLNEFWHGDQFWRSMDRYAPHNAYTSTDLLGTYVQRKKDAGRTADSLYGVWKFKAEASSEIVEQNFFINYIAPDYSFGWKFDLSQKKYVRQNDSNESEFTQDKKQILADNIAVVITDVSVIDAIGRRKIRTVGTGEAFVFQDGKQIEAKWSKQSETERLKFLHKDGKEIEMNPGVTWIEVVGDQSQLTVQK